MNRTNNKMINKEIALDTPSIHFRNKYRTLDGAWRKSGKKSTNLAKHDGGRETNECLIQKARTIKALG